MNTAGRDVEASGDAGDDLAGVFRRESGPCTATLARVLGDIDLAEDAVAEAFAIAADQWPSRGIPPNPGGWITTTARRRAIDRLRRESTRTDRYAAAHRIRTTGPGMDDTGIDGTDGPFGPGDRDEVDRIIGELDALVDAVPDDQLRLIFTCCHPALAADAQVALTLRLLGGLTTPEIAAAFLAPEATIAQRIVRAKRKLAANRAAFRVPPAAQLPDRLGAVLATISLIFTEGHRATSGTTLVRTDLSGEAIRLARLVVDLMPDEPEAVGLLALLLLTDARRPARFDGDGSFVPLSDQHRSRWDRALIDEGHELVRACLRRDRPGPFQIQAAIAAVHADAARAEDTDWSQIVALYDHLAAFRPDAVVLLNRAVAVAELHGPERALAELDRLDTSAFSTYQPYHAAVADLLARSGRNADAIEAYDRAIALSTHDTEIRFLRARRSDCTI